MKSENLDQLIDKALSTPPEWEMPDTFTECLMQRLEKRIALRDILFDFGLKIAILIGVIFILAVVLYLTNWDKPLDDIVLVRLILENIVPIAMGLVGIAFTFFIDQVLLRFFSRRRDLGV